MDGEPTQTTCATCSCEFETKPSPWFPPARHCPSCTAIKLAESEAAEKKRQEDQHAQYRKSQWERICPPIYQETDPARINPKCLKAAMEWSLEHADGLGFIGGTGAGKTRAAFIALKRAFDANQSCAAVSHNAFSCVVISAFSGTDEERQTARNKLTTFQQCEVLLLDDLGKPPTTERVDAELEELVEIRTSHNRPILWTSNGSSAWLIKRMGADRGPALVRRLSEFSEIVTP